MLTIPVEMLAYIVTKAREFDAEVPPVNEDTGSNPADDADRDVLEASADNPTRQGLPTRSMGWAIRSGSSCWRSLGSAAAITGRRNGARRSKKHAASTRKRRPVT
jgi:hypothetical protein